ncbi:MAG TPA: ribonuclease III [Gammaproteobacteria bacterium]|nr:ribonuclease III [Gammaproteobacteria bacterium]
MDISALTRSLGYTFNNHDLLRLALTHRSAGSANNERLEYLGDSVLNFIIAAELFERCPDLHEGDLSRMRAHLVKGERLFELASHLKLGDVLQLGTGELKSGGHHRASILADALEAILGAIYSDGGYEACKRVVLHLYQSLLDNLPQPEALKDPKTRLQEWLQSHQFPLPQYEIISTHGKQHERKFQVACMLSHIDLRLSGTGNSRRKAEQSAASKTLELLCQQNRTNKTAS